MSRSFGIFKTPPPKNKRDEAILVAFGMGGSAARKDKLRSSNPYQPLGQQALYEAWNCGYDEEDVVYFKKEKPCSFI